MVSRQPAQLNNIYGWIDPYLKTEKRGGIVNATSPGYHTSMEDLIRQGRAGDYSIQCPADKRGDKTFSSGIDITFGTLAELVLVHTRLRVACTPVGGKYDPRIECVREIIGTLDGRNVSGYNRVSTGTQSRAKVGWVASGFSDPSHLWHEHISVLRDRCNNENEMRGLAEVICGVPAGALGWKGEGVDTPAVPPPVIVEYPMPTSGAIYLDKLVAGTQDSDSVAYIQIMLAKVLKIVLLRTGDYDPATIAAATKYQRDVLEDDPKNCDGFLGQLQTLDLVERTKSPYQVYRSSVSGGLLTKAVDEPVVKPSPKPGVITLRLKDWQGSPAGRTLIQCVRWNPLDQCYFIVQADTVPGQGNVQDVVVRRHDKAGIYKGFATLKKAGHGSSVGIVPWSPGVTRVVIGHKTLGAGYVTYTIGDPDTPFTRLPVPNGDITCDAGADLLCVRVKTRYRCYRLSDAFKGKATLLWDITIPDWGERFQGHLVTKTQLYVHRDVKTKGASELRAFNHKGTRRQTWNTDPWGDEAEGAMTKDGWVYSVSRVGGDSPSRTVVCTPIETIR